MLYYTDKETKRWDVVLFAASRGGKKKVSCALDRLKNKFNQWFPHAVYHCRLSECFLANTSQ